MELLIVQDRRFSQSEPQDFLWTEEGDKEGRKTEDSWSTTGIFFIYRHHEELRLKLYDPDHETFPIPLKYVDVMRQTQTSINNVSEHILNDKWTNANGVHLSEEWTGSTRFQTLRTWLLEGYKCAVESPTKIRKTTRPDSTWPEAWTQLSKETRRIIRLKNGQNEHDKLEAARRNRRIYEVMSDDTRSLQGGCWCSAETGHGYCSCFAVHCEGMTGEGNLRQLYNFSWCQWGAVRFRKFRSMWKVKRQQMNHIAEKGYVGSCHHCSVHELVFIEDALKMPGAKATVDKKMERIKHNSSLGCQESETKIWRHLSGEEGWKNSSLRDFDGPLSLEERRTCKTLPEIQGANCAPGGHRQRRRRIQSSIHRARRLSFTDGSSNSSWTLSHSFLVWLEKQVTRSQLTLKYKMTEAPLACYNCRRKNLLKFGSEFLHDKDPVVPFERN